MFLMIIIQYGRSLPEIKAQGFNLNADDVDLTLSSLVANHHFRRVSDTVGLS